MSPKGRMLRLLLTILFVATGAFGGYYLAHMYQKAIESTTKFVIWDVGSGKLPPEQMTLLYSIFIVVGAMVGFVVERAVSSHVKKLYDSVEEMSPKDKLVVGCGLVVGLVLALIMKSIFLLHAWAAVIAVIVMCYMSVAVFYNLKEQIALYFPSAENSALGNKMTNIIPKLMDTNIIIDGRIADICRAGFIEGPIYVPKFVLEELQQIADSSDSLKRARGRRGLEILNQMQKEMDLQVPDFVADDTRAEVDSRLVLVAKDIGAVIITNDYNLNKVAGLQGVTVLNINELANALKPVVLPGEEMRVLLIKEGKEKEQGIGYLDDGTMIVVEGGRRMIGETLDVSVTSVLQTVQGKMIFGKTKDSPDTGPDNFEKNSVRSFTGGRPRTKTR